MDKSVLARGAEARTAVRCIADWIAFRLSGSPLRPRPEQYMPNLNSE
jgi:hypothetical protein